MKLATYRDGSRDGQLVVVSRDLALAHYASGIATRLQQVLDDWNFLSPQLQELSQTLNHGKARHAFAFDPAMCMAPLPRAHQRLEVVDGALAQAASDALLGPRDDVRIASEKMGISFEPGLAAVTGDIAPGASPDAALEGIRLWMLTGSVCLREVGDALQRRPTAAFSPVAVTADELGAAWRGGRLHATLEWALNGKRHGGCDAAAQPVPFGDLIAHAAKTRPLRAGGIVGGVVDSESAIGPLRHGDAVRLAMNGADGLSLFGAIEAVIAPLDA